MNNFFTYDLISKFEFLDSEKIIILWDNIRNKKLSNLYGMWALLLLQWSKQLDMVIINFVWLFLFKQPKFITKIS